MQNFTFLNKILLFSSNSTVSSVETLQILRALAGLFPLRFIWLDDHKLGIFGTDILGVISYIVELLSRE